MPKKYVLFAAALALAGCIDPYYDEPGYHNGYHEPGAVYYNNGYYTPGPAVIYESSPGRHSPGHYRHDYKHKDKHHDKHDKHKDKHHDNGQTVVIVQPQQPKQPQKAPKYVAPTPKNTAIKNQPKAQPKPAAKPAAKSGKKKGK